MGIEQLENKGFSFLNIENINKDKRQIVVVGSARGGTSLVAGALHHLGIFTGDKSNAPVFEDVLLSEAFESNDLATAKIISDRYTKEHDVWAWKRPAALNYLDKVEKIIPNPFYIFIFKDIFAIANRNSISMKADISKGLTNALVDYGKIVEFTSKTDKPVMLVSAEKALQNKDAFVDALIEANKDLQCSYSNRANAIGFITPNPKNYLDQTRLSKCKGVVGEVGSNHIQGWCFNVHNQSAPTIVEVYSDDNLIATSIAKDFRKGLFVNGAHPTGMCGFKIVFKEGLIGPRSKVKVIAKGDVVELDNGLFEWK